MICFKYSLNQDSVELQASDWSGLERVYVNGEMVSSKLNFAGQSEHQVPLKDGNKAKFQLFIDPQTEEVMCRIYKKGQLVASLKQGQQNLSRAQNLLWQSLLGVSMVGGLVILMVR